MSPTVSVITPFYNSEKYIKDAIKSIINQTYTDFEYILVNDCSSDKSLFIAKQFAKKDKRLKVIDLKKNVGAAEAFNKGYKVSKGKLIARFDSDDISLKDRIEKQVKIFNSWSDLSILGGSIKLIDKRSKIISKKINFPSNLEELNRIIKFKVPIADPSSMIKREVFEKIGLFRKFTEPADDLDFWLRAIKNNLILTNIDDVLIYYRIHENNLSLIKFKEQIINSIFVRKLSHISVNQTLSKLKNKNIKSIEDINGLLPSKNHIKYEEFYFNYFLNIPFNNKDIENSISKFEYHKLQKKNKFNNSKIGKIYLIISIKFLLQKNIFLFIHFLIKSVFFRNFLIFKDIYQYLFLREYTIN